MFAAGDLVVYGGEGVCRVESIGPSGLAYDGGDKVYYHLSPLYRGGTVMTPVDTAVLMRPIISRDCALKLIAALPALPEQKPAERGMRAAKDFYHQLVLRCDCAELAAMIHGICRKRAWALRRRAGRGTGYAPGSDDPLYPPDLGQVARAAAQAGVGGAGGGC